MIKAIRKKTFVIAVSTVCLIVLMVIPFEITVVPEWKLRVVDQTGQGLKGNRVRESWSHYTLETQSHEEEQLSDANGYVQFPRRTIRTNIITWAAKFAARIVNVHSSFGPSASAHYLGEYTLASDQPWYEPGRPLASEIVVWRPK
ncbi:MAG TPA: hypothetical protein VGW76_02500 [Pyrinomonadaceae bacterium]|nr:hypothetical protein [Pyrinomonadaceae bacterium]